LQGSILDQKRTRWPATIGWPRCKCDQPALKPMRQSMEINWKQTRVGPHSSESRRQAASEDTIQYYVQLPYNIMYTISKKLRRFVVSI
jgi:hypothetical protein